MIKLFMNSLGVNEVDGEELELAISYPNDEGYYLTQSRGEPDTAFPNYQNFPVFWNVKDKTFLTWSQRGNNPYNNESMIAVYDHYTKKISNSVALGEINPVNNDPHLTAALIVLNDNKIMIVEENPHNGTIYVKKSTNSYDINSISNFSNYAGNYAYPQIYQFTNNDIYILTRRTIPIGAISKSTDLGATWSHWDILNVTAGNWAYPNCFYDSDRLHYILNYRYTSASTPAWFPYVFYITSTDGITWTNLDGSFSKNVVSEGVITEAELKSDCVVHYGGDDSYAIRCPGGIVSNSVVYMLHGQGSTGWYFTYSSAGSWTKKAIDFGAYTILDPIDYAKTGNNTGNNSIGLYKIDATTFDLYIIEWYNNSYKQLVKFRTTNLGDSWSFVERLTTTLDNHHQQIQQVHKGNKKLIGCIRQTDSSYSDLFIKEVF